MEIKSALFLVESPMQLINAIEAKHYFNVEKSYLFIRFGGNKSNDRQIDFILSNLDDNFSHITMTKVDEYKKIDYIKILYPVFVFIRFLPEFIFIGNYYSGYSRLVRALYPNNKKVFLDDGSQTTHLYYDKPQLNMFSYFSFEEILPNRLYVHHNFEYTKSVLSSSHPLVKGNEILFIGTPLVERNLVTINDFNELMSRLVKHFNSYTIIYVPHRYEDVQKMLKYENVSIRRLDVPIELYLLQSDTLSGRVVSFYSAALYTIFSIFGNILDVQAYKIPSNYFVSPEYAKGVEKLYEFLSKSMTIINNYETE